MQSSILLYNSRLLSGYGYSTFPTKLTDFSNMLQDITTMEHQNENFQISGYTSSFTSEEDWITLVSEWIAGANSSIINQYGRLGVYDTDFADALAVIASWMSNGVLDPANIDSYDKTAAFTRWSMEQSVVLHTTTSVLTQTADIAFDWGIAAMPPFIPEAISTMGTISGTGVTTGRFLAVLKNSTNAGAAVKTIKSLGSIDFQRQLISEGSAVSQTLIPTYSSLLQEPIVAETLGSYLVTALLKTNYTTKPTTQSGTQYHQVSTLIAQSMGSIFHSQQSISDALDTLDLALRSLLAKPPRNASQDDDLSDTAPISVVPGKKALKYLAPQVALLFCTMTVVLGGILYDRHKKLESMNTSVAKETQQETRHLVEKQQNAVRDAAKDGMGVILASSQSDSIFDDPTQVKQKHFPGPSIAVAIPEGGSAPDLIDMRAFDASQQQNASDDEFDDVSLVHPNTNYEESQKLIG